LKKIETKGWGVGIHLREEVGARRGSGKVLDRVAKERGLTSGIGWDKTGPERTVAVETVPPHEKRDLWGKRKITIGGGKLPANKIRSGGGELQKKRS